MGRTQTKILTQTETRSHPLSTGLTVHPSAANFEKEGIGHYSGGRYSSCQYSGKYDWGGRYSGRSILHVSVFRVSEIEKISLFKTKEMHYQILFYENIRKGYQIFCHCVIQTRLINGSHASGLEF